MTTMILVSILLIAFGNFQSELHTVYPDVEYDEANFKIANTTDEIINISNEIQLDIVKIQVEEASLAEKASAFIGGGLNTGKLALKAPAVALIGISDLADKGNIPLTGIIALVGLLILITVIISLLMWIAGRNW